MINTSSTFGQAIFNTRVQILVVLPRIGLSNDDVDGYYGVVKSMKTHHFVKPISFLLAFRRDKRVFFLIIMHISNTYYFGYMKLWPISVIITQILICVQISTIF